MAAWAKARAAIGRAADIALASMDDTEEKLATAGERLSLVGDAGMLIRIGAHVGALVVASAQDKSTASALAPAAAAVPVSYAVTPAPQATPAAQAASETSPATASRVVLEENESQTDVLLVANVAPFLAETALRDLCATIGAPVSVQLLRPPPRPSATSSDAMGRRALVRFTDTAAVSGALASLDGLELGGRRLQVSRAPAWLVAQAALEASLAASAGREEAERRRADAAVEAAEAAAAGLKAERARAAGLATDLLAVRGKLAATAGAEAGAEDVQLRLRAADELAASLRGTVSELEVRAHRRGRREGGEKAAALPPPGLLLLVLQASVATSAARISSLDRQVSGLPPVLGPATLLLQPPAEARDFRVCSSQPPWRPQRGG